jgi:2-pyrone-4,6-dicarboxylate lactonase
LTEHPKIPTTKIRAGLTRSSFLAGFAATVAAMAAPVQGEGAMPEGTKPRFDMPPGACDCHVHTFAPELFPFSPKRSYTPGAASVDDLVAFQSLVGMQRCVLVQPSSYGADNACLLDSLMRLGNRARGVAVIDAELTSNAELDALSAAGVRSVRVNLEAQGDRDPRSAERALESVSRRVGPRNWSIQIYASLTVIAELKELVLRLPVPLVLDHFGDVRGEGGVDQPGFSTLVEMLKSGRVYVKLSAPYRSSKRPPDYQDLAPIARALIAAAPESMIWASDWPHTGGGATGSNDRQGRTLAEIEPFRKVDVPHVLSRLADWSPDHETWRRILVENPARLYSFV